MNKRWIGFIMTAMLCACVAFIGKEAIAKAAMVDEAENYELGEQYSGIGDWKDRYYKFEITENSHVTLYVEKEERGTSFEIYDSMGKLMLRNEDILYEEKNAATNMYYGNLARNLSVGNYYLKIYAGYKFSFTIQAEKQIKLPKGSIASLHSRKSGQITVSCTPAEEAIGYRIQYSTDYKFKKGVKTIHSDEATRTISGLKKGKKYYVKVCPYAVYDDGVTVYGQNSKVKAVKVKK